MTRAQPEVLSNSELTAHVLCGLVANLLVKNSWHLVTAESCTGGMIAASCTDLAGSSTWFERGFVTYSNAAKTEMLGVDAALIAREGAVSEAVVRAMAQGALQRAKVEWAVAVTGIAGPTGGSPQKPVGTVWFGWASPRGIASEMRHFCGDRSQVRIAAVQYALRGVLEQLHKHSAP